MNYRKRGTEGLLPCSRDGRLRKVFTELQYNSDISEGHIRVQRERERERRESWGGIM
jgi:hypothetical protein